MHHQGGIYERKRKIRFSSWIHSDFRRLCNWNRKCMEVPLHGWTGRRRCIRTLLSHFLAHARTSYYDNGICRWKSKSEKSCKSLLRFGKTRTEMAYPRLHHINRMLSVNDVLHNRCRMDASLLLSDRNWKVYRTRFRDSIRTV